MSATIPSVSDLLGDVVLDDVVQSNAATCQACDAPISKRNNVNEFRLDVDLSSERTIIRMAGDYDAHSVTVAAPRLRQFGRGDHVIVDLRDVTMLTSAALTQLDELRRRTMDSVQPLRFYDLTPWQRQLFKISGFDRGGVPETRLPPQAAVV